MTTESERDRRNAQNARVIEEFRANAGQVGGGRSASLLLLTTKGAKSGLTRVNPVAYLSHESRTFVFASKGGAPHHPDWYHNLVANPDVVVEMGDRKFSARAIVITGPERDDIYARQVAQNPVFGEYQAKTTRSIPVVELVPSAD